VPAHFRVCRDCGEEYRPGVVRCADCGGELEDRFEGQGNEGAEEGAAPAGARVEEPAPSPTDHRALFVTPFAADLVPMAERLRAAGVEYRLAEAPGRVEGAPSRYGLFVREENAAAALAAIADLVAPHGGAEAVETRFDGEQGYLECPACGTKTSAGTAECPECGLVLGAGEGEVETPGD
jgi:ribosomal protein L32